MKNQYERILVVDLEATCWNTPLEKHHNTSEIIEIGISVLNLKSGEIESSEGLLVKPELSKVSAFCTELTSLTQQDVDQGFKFADACDVLIEEYDSLNTPWASFGAYDFSMFEKQCKRLGIKNPMSKEHINVKLLCSIMSQSGKRLGMAKALEMHNIELSGRHHRGVDDAFNIAKLLKKLLKK